MRYNMVTKMRLEDLNLRSLNISHFFLPFFLNYYYLLFIVYCTSNSDDRLITFEQQKLRHGEDFYDVKVDLSLNIVILIFLNVF